MSASNHSNPFPFFVKLCPIHVQFPGPVRPSHLTLSLVLIAFVYFNWSLALPAGFMPSNALHDFSILFAPLASYFLESAIIRIYWIVFTAKLLALPRSRADHGPAPLIIVTMSCDRVVFARGKSF